MPTNPFQPIADSPLADCLSELVSDPVARSGRARLCCPEDFTGFAGHFPGAPILPAVVQLMAVRLLAETIAATPLEEVAAERLKFKGMVQPAEVINIQVNLRQDQELLRAAFALDRAGAQVASGTLVFRQVSAGD